MKKTAAFLLFSLSICAARAQMNYTAVDNTVDKLGALPSLNIATIADTITSSFHSNEEKARAIFFWITHNIAIDPKATRQHDDKSNLPEQVIALRRATPLGFSLLVQEMCSDANIRCISVDGYTKNSFEDIGQPADEINHSWNVVQLGQSPDTWFFVDACRGSGSLDKKMTTFIKNYNPSFFFSDRKVFNGVNFPDNSAWQLGGGIKSKKDFFSQPVITNDGVAVGIMTPTPLTGFIKAKTGRAVSFSFAASAAPKEITIITGEDKRASKPEAVTFAEKSGLISFTYTFKKSDSFPVTILGDGKPLLIYSADVED